MSLTSKAISVLCVDSGVGGLQYLTQFVSLWNRAVHIHYLADTEKFPYAQLSAKQLMLRLEGLLCYEDYGLQSVDRVVLACNTLATAWTSYLALDASCRSSCKVLGVTPSLDEARRRSHSGHILLIASAHTSRSVWVDEGLQAIAQDQHVVCARMGSAQLVSISEHDFFEQYSGGMQQHITVDKQSSDREQFAQHLQIVLTADPLIDVVLLACTHFSQVRPWIESVLQQSLPTRHIAVVDSSAVCAQNHAALLSSLHVDDPAIEAQQQESMPSVICEVYSDYISYKRSAITDYLKQHGIVSRHHSFQQKIAPYLCHAKEQ